jgi:hypothetical protein
MAFAAVGACGGLPRPAAGIPDAELQGIVAAVATATGYPIDHIEATGNRSRIRFAITDASLADAGQADRELVAGSVVAAAQIKMVACQPCDAIEALSVAIIHSPSQQSRGIWHVEDVVEFRRGAKRKFQMHAT